MGIFAMSDLLEREDFPQELETYRLKQHVRSHFTAGYEVLMTTFGAEPRKNSKATHDPNVKDILNGMVGGAQAPVSSPRGKSPRGKSPLPQAESSGKTSTFLDLVNSSGMAERLAQ